MKIVIDIPKYVYDTIIDFDGYISDCDIEKVGNALKNGTPIPDNTTNGDMVGELYPDEFPYWKQPNSRGTFETSELNQKLMNYFQDLLDEAYQKGIKRGKELQLAECERRVNEIIKNLHKQEECGSNE